MKNFKRSRSLFALALAVVICGTLVFANSRYTGGFRDSSTTTTIDQSRIETITMRLDDVKLDIGGGAFLSGVYGSQRISRFIDEAYARRHDLPGLIGGFITIKQDHNFETLEVFRTEPPESEIYHSPSWTMGD